MKKVSVLGILCVFMVFLGSCKKSAPTVPEVPVKPVGSAVTVTSINSTISVGQTEQMIATTTMSDGTIKDTIGTWGSDNTNVAIVNQSGVVQGISPGTATIYIDTTEWNLRGTKLLRVRKLWSKKGRGASVFDMPTYVSRVTITGVYTGRGENFVVYIAGHLIVNEILGTAWGGTTYSGTFLTNGGVVEVKYSNGLSWSFKQVLATTAVTNSIRKLTNIPSQSDPRYREYEIYKRVAAEIK